MLPFMSKCIPVIMRFLAENKLAWGNSRFDVNNVCPQNISLSLPI